MLRAPLRARPLLLALTLLLASSVGPAVAAEDADAAVRALFDAVSARDLADLDGLVCADQQDVVRAAFGDAGLGIDLMAESFGSMAVSVTDPEIELLSLDEVSASARVTATLAIEVDGELLRAFVRELIETSAGPDDPPATDEDLAAMVPLVAEALALEQPIEAEVELAVEDGEWVVCGGLTGAATDDDAHGADPVVSNEGLCALATPAELSRLSSLEYDSSTGFNEFCTYSWSAWDEYHASTVGLIFGSTLDEWREVFPPDDEFEIAGVPAFSSGANLFVEAGRDVLQVIVSLPGSAPKGVDALLQARRISELLLPRLSGLVIAEPEPTSETWLGVSLCDSLSLLELNRIAGRGFDKAEGDPWSCAWSSSDPTTGLDTVVATVSDLTLDDFRGLLGEMDEATIDGQPGLSSPTQAIVGLPDGRTLDVSVHYDPSLEPELPAGLLALRTVEWLLHEVPAEPAAPTTPIAGDGLLAGRDWVDDLCAAVPYEALAAISGVPFEDPGLGTDFCEYYGGNTGSGWHYALTSLEHRAISLWRSDYPGASSIEIAGQPALLVEGVLAEIDSSALAIVVVPGFDDLTFAAAIGIDTSTGTVVDTAAVAMDAATLGIAALVGTGD